MDKVYIGIAGFSGKKFNTDIAINMIARDFLRLKEVYEDKQIWIVSGLTNIGIPAIAYKLAVTHGFKTMGIACKLAKDYECFECNTQRIVGQNWGDESQTFLNTIQELYCYGGGSPNRRGSYKSKENGYSSAC